MKQIEVTIMGQSYILACAEGRESALLEAVNHVDHEMCSIRDAGKVKARERIAVLAALNIAFELAHRHATAGTEAAVIAPESGLADPSLAGLDVQSLIRRLDEALGQDGQLV